MNSAILSPSWTLLGIEPFRAAFEYASCRLMDHSRFEPGDGHPVVVFPGLAADAQTVSPLLEFCRRLGYDARDWGRGLNTGPSGDIDAWLDTLAEEVEARYSHEGGDPHGHAAGGITLIGWSLGGIYAREIAKRMSVPIRQVITIGTPITGEAAQTNVSLLYRWVSGALPELDPDFKQRLMAAPPQPLTAIHSRSDGVVAWEACLQSADHDWIENVEVDSSHCGLCWNPAVLGIIADRLAQAPETWMPWQAASMKVPALGLQTPQ